MAIRQPLSTGTSESSIIFYNGGHSHDGISSAFIDTAKYSIYDFTTNFMGTDSRQITQGNNFRDFTNVITKIVKESILGPSGITLTPNQVRAENISAGAVTATSLAANIVLVNNIISSNNYVANVSGWAISSNGTAEFANTSIRGTITANSLTTPGIDIHANGNLIAANFALYGNGAIITSSGNFGVSAAGVLSATGASITGTIEASSLATPGIIIDANGDLTANNFVLFADGSIVTSSGNFSVDASGNLFANNAEISGDIYASGGEIAGWEIGADTISASGGEIKLYQEAGYGAVIAGAGAGTQIILNSEAQLHAEFNGIDTDINFQTDSAYVFRITDGSQLIKIAPLLISASVGGSFSYLANDGIATTGEVSMDTASVNGIGIAYPGCTTGPGTFDKMGLVWNNPDIRGTVNNAASMVLGTLSDVRSKSYILNAEDTWLNKLYDSLRVVSFNPVDLLDEENLHLYPRRLGLIAQEVDEVLPNLVVSANPYDEEAFLSVNYLGLVPYLIQAVQDLNNRVKELENEV